MKKSVGLIVMSKIPKAGKEVLVAVLQRRGRFNTEKMAPESYPSCCQVTSHGKLFETEKLFEGLFREAREELGQPFSGLVKANVSRGIQMLTHVADKEKEVTTFGVLVPTVWLKAIQWGPDSGGADLIAQENLDDIVEIADEMKVTGPEFIHTLAMFPDEIEAVRKAFEIFGKK